MWRLLAPNQERDMWCVFFHGSGCSVLGVGRGEVMAYISGLVLACVFGSGAIVAQQRKSPEPQPGPPPAAAAGDPEAAISPARLAKNILYDQKPIWTFPGQVVRGK